MNPSPLLSISGLTKTYSTVVLADVHFELEAGEVHALVGENGAGKSTLARVIAGLTQPDRAVMRLRGEPFAPADKKEAEQRGVRLIMQELNLIGNLSIAEHIFLDQLPHRWGWIDYPRLNARAQKAMLEVGLRGVDPKHPVRTLGVGQQQLVEIAGGLSRRCDLLILDEPTAALTCREIEQLFIQLRKLRQSGVGIVYISHRLEEIQQIADRITVLRDGQIVRTRRVSEIRLAEIVQLMVGRELGEALDHTGRTAGPRALLVRGLKSGDAVRDVSFHANQGEILGFAGLMGSGRTETMRAIFGADRAERGEVFLHGSTVPARIRSPRDAVRQGMALLTEDRKGQGLLLPLPVRVNVTLARLEAVSWGRSWIKPRADAAEAERWASALNVRCGTVEQPVIELSGGNQQKVVISKWLFRHCEILIFDEPTRGIDVGAKFEIYQLLRKLADEGKAILVVSSELPELLAICDRIAVMSAGRVAASFSRGEWTQEKIMAAALSGYLNHDN